MSKNKNGAPRARRDKYERAMIGAATLSVIGGGVIAAAVAEGSRISEYLVGSTTSPDVPALSPSHVTHIDASAPKHEHPAIKTLKKHGKTVVITKQDMQPPLLPANHDYTLAADATLNSGGDASEPDIQQITAELGKITDPNIRKEARVAVDTGFAAEASIDASDGGGLPNYKLADKYLDAIHGPGVKTSAIDAVDADIAATAALDATSGEYAAAAKLEGRIQSPAMRAQVDEAISDQKHGKSDAADAVWSGLNDAAANKWNTLNNASASRWYRLDLHTPAYHREYKNAPNGKPAK